MPNPNSPIQIKSNGPFSAKLSLNLNAYIRSFEERETAEHERIKAELLELLYGLTGALHWQEMLNKCFTETTDAEEAKQTIERSSASSAMNESFAELIKNLVDEIILRHFSNRHDPSKGDKLELILKVQLENDRVSLELFDNGPGFPATLLERLSSDQQMQNYNNYIRETESPKDTFDNTKPQLLGGEGRGLKQLIVRVLYGTNLEHTMRLPGNKIAGSSIEFSNKPEAGACISIITSSAAQAMPEYSPRERAPAAAAAPAPLPTSAQVSAASSGPRRGPRLFVIVPPTLMAANADADADDQGPQPHG